MTTSGKSPGRVVVVGGVAAGMSAASQIRRRRPDARVTVFERGGYISYGACGMPYNLEDPERAIEDLVVLSPEKARKERGIELELRHEVTEIDLERMDVEVADLEGGGTRREPFDALVVATGARAVRLPLPGFDLPGVEVLRTLDDGAKIKHLLEDDPARVVVIGAGYIGMEMAHGHEETVALVADELENHGVAVRTGAAVEGAEAGADGTVGAVVADGESFEADVVLVAAGVRPNAELAAAAGLRIGDTGAIWANQSQQSSHPAVWVAGDCAEAYHRVLRRNAWIPLGTTANKQGRIAGANVAGAEERYAGIVGTAGFVVFDLEVARSGLSEKEARAEGFDPVAVTIRQRSRAHAYPDGSP
ncbi:MAG: FAD-dependent oxidoreductase, partial [Acidobacteriota bacterium]